MTIFMFQHLAHTSAAPHEAGIAAFRALFAVRNAAYDHVRSAAESGLPFDREYCSARAPS